MADIKIERKKSNKPIWPWIVGLLLLAGIIWAISAIDTDPEAEGVAVVEETYTEEPVVTDPQANRYNEENTMENQDFVAFVNNTEVKERMGLDHEVTSEAFTKLAESLSNISENEDKYSQQINEIRQTADEIRTDPQSLQHANKVNQAFTQAANVMAQIQQDRFPDAESTVNEVEESANKLNNNEQLLNQKEEVDNFFEKAADAVEEMKENASA